MLLQGRFCPVVELHDQKIVTLSRYLYQHARPLSEVIQSAGNGFRQREPGVDKVPPVAQVGVQDKHGDVDVEMTVTTDRTRRRISSERLPGASTSRGYRALAAALKLAVEETPEKAKASAA